MNKFLAGLLAGCALLALPAVHAADPAGSALPIEYELANDFAARLQAHLQQTGQILQQLRQTTDPGERDRLMQSYFKAVHTAVSISHTMQRLLDSGKGMAGERKMGMGMKGGGKCSCGMMPERAGKKAGKAAPAQQAEQGDGAPGQESEADGEDAPGEHEGHH
jgi:hypothetical protein